MSASARDLKIVPKSHFDSTKGPGDIPLYYKNVGLFSDPFLDELCARKSKDSFLLQSWETEDLPDFSKAYEWMLQTWDNFRDLIPSWSEAELESKWIRPVMEKLGWSYQAQVSIKRFGKRDIPDYALFESDTSYKKAQKPYNAEDYDAFFDHVLAVADAKKCGVSLDGSKQDNSNPSFQIIWYLQMSGRKWGILTDGIYWRLYSSQAKNKASSYFEVNIQKFLEERNDELFKFFYNFFRKEAFVQNAASKQSFLDVVFARGEIYAAEAEKDLKEKTFELVELLCQGFATSKKPRTVEELKEIYHHSIYYMFQLLFVLNAEAKGLLNVGNQSDYYPYSLRKLCEEIRADHAKGQTWAKVASSYKRLQTLFELLQDGDASIGIFGLGKEVFSSGSGSFYLKCAIADASLNRVLLELSCEEGKDGKWRFIDYKRLSADHLGSIFEGLLEFSLIEDSGAPGGVALVNSDGERKRTGAFYTPDYVVDHMVAKTLDPVIKDLSISEVLKLKVADIAMGSGHFLLGVVRYLEGVVLEKASNGEKLALNPSDLRWEILHSCVYGFDINPLAVELAKFSLWIYSARPGFELEPLADQFITTNSLIHSAKLLKAVGLSKGFDAVISNPPYVRQESLMASKDEHENAFDVHHSMADLYVYFFEQAYNVTSKTGQICLITTNKWMKAEYGRPLRGWLKEVGINSICNFGDLPVFKGVAAYPCISSIDKSNPAKEVVYRKVEKLPTGESEPLTVPEDSIKRALSEMGGESWTFQTKEEQSANRKLKKIAATFSSIISDEVYYGIKTGLTKAFVVDKDTFKQISSSDKNSARQLRPFLMGRDLGKYQMGKASKYLVYLPKGWTKKTYGDGKKEAEYWKLLQKDLPGIAGHLAQFEKQGKARSDMGDFWWELRACDYYDKFQKKKIIYQTFQVKPCFTLDSEGSFFNNSVWFAATEDLFLLGYLNSKLGWHETKKVCTDIQNGVQLIYQYLGKLMVPEKSKCDSSKVNAVEKLVAKRLECLDPKVIQEIEGRIDFLFYEIVGLTQGEIRAIEEDSRPDSLQKSAGNADTSDEAA